ncbi:MFS transporter [Marinitoga lauensis]|uniref:MFS transporter n=1 Tax=Marinitoga lauensis TaxID=2201189 RepID=UPI00101024F1|nr:MFS transporter [Marinitoga lauensis]
MNKNELIFGFSSFFLFGYSLIMTSSLIPMIEKTYNIDHSLVGLAFTLGTLGFLLSSVIYGYLLEKHNAFKTILSGIIFFFFGNLLMLFMNSYIFMILGIFFINFGGGALEISIPFLIGVSGNGKKGKKLNLLHSSFAVGALTSPIISSLILKYSNYWKGTFFIAVLMNIIPFIFLILIKKEVDSLHNNYLLQEKSSLKGVFNFSLVILVLSLSFYVGYEMNFSSWISTFLFEFRNFDISTAALYPSFLWLGLFLGRAFLSHFPEKFGYKKWLLIVVPFSLIFSIFTVAFGKNIVISSIGTILTGIGFSTTYPTIQAIVVEKYKNNKGIALSVASASTSIISGGFSYLIGVIGSMYGLLYGFFIIIGLNILEILFVSLIDEKV